MKCFAYDTVDSTNEAAKRLIRSGELRGPACIIAAEQTAGRGTNGRHWVSPRDAGIYMTIALRDESVAGPDTLLHTLAAGVACAEAIEEWAKISVALKPVNDLMAGNRKLGGILTEAVVEDSRLVMLLVGVGINLRRFQRTLPTGAPPAVSIEELLPEESWKEANQNRLVESVFEQVERWHECVARGELGPLRTGWAKRAKETPEILLSRRC